MVTSDLAWVFLTYRLPREPSAPRLALWRAVRRLGALQVSDGLVVLPRSPRTVEHLQWLAAEIRERDGSAGVWHARADSARDDELYVDSMRSAVDDEYRTVLDEARRADAIGVDTSDRRRLVRRLRGELRRIALRDYFRAPTGEAARREVDRIARMVEAVAP